MHLRIFVVWLLSALLSNAMAFSEPCQLVAQMAGNKEYQQQPFRMASMTAESAMPKALQLTLLESHGAWHVYHSDTPWVAKEACAPITKHVAGKTVEFSPVILNKKTGHNAVVTGSFIVKIYRKQHWQKIMQKYGFKMLSPLPNPKAQIVDVKPTASYDLLIRELDLDKDVSLALPLLSEPRPRN